MINNKRILFTTIVSALTIIFLTAHAFAQTHLSSAELTDQCRIYLEQYNPTANPPQKFTAEATAALTQCANDNICANALSNMPTCISKLSSWQAISTMPPTNTKQMTAAQQTKKTEMQSSAPTASSSNTDNTENYTQSQTTASSDQLMNTHNKTESSEKKFEKAKEKKSNSSSINWF